MINEMDLSKEQIVEIINHLMNHYDLYDQAEANEVEELVLELHSTAK